MPGPDGHLFIAALLPQGNGALIGVTQLPADPNGSKTKALTPFVHLEIELDLARRVAVINIFNLASSILSASAFTKEPRRSFAFLLFLGSRHRGSMITT